MPLVEESLNVELCDGIVSDFDPQPVGCKYRNGKLGSLFMGPLKIDRISVATDCLENPFLLRKDGRILSTEG